MASIAVKQISPDFNCLRPTNRSLTYNRRASSLQERSRSCEPRTRIRLKTAPNSALDSLRLSEREVESLIVERAKECLLDLKKVFKTLDVFRTGTVTQAEFARVLQSYCNLILPQNHFSRFFHKLGVKKDGSVSYVKFITSYFGNENVDRGVNSNKTERKDECKEDFENELKAKLQVHYAYILKTMQLFDYERDGFIQKQDLRRILENFCVKMTDLQFERLWAKYHWLTRGSTLRYVDFLDSLSIDNFNNEQRMMKSRQHVVEERPRTPQPSQKSGNYTEQIFKKRFLVNYDNIYRAVRKLDHRDCGYVSLKELKKLVEKYTLSMSDSMFHTLLRSCGIKASHRVNYERFMDYYGKARTNILWQPESTTMQEDVFSALQSHINSSFTSIKDAFLEFDFNKDGKISRSELRRIVEKFSFRLSEEDYAQFMSRVDPEHKGYISYHRFLELFENKPKENHLRLNKRPASVPTSPQPRSTWETVQDVLRSKIKENWQSVSSAFMTVDANRDGYLSRDELRNLLAKFALSLTNEHFEILWSLCDENKDGKIAFSEFLKQLGVDIISSDTHGLSTKISDESEAREDFVKRNQHARRDHDLAEVTADQALGVIRNYIFQRSSDIRKIFVKFDSNNDGEISRGEFLKVLESLGLCLLDGQFDILCFRMGFSNGTLSYNKFLKNFGGDLLSQSSIVDWRRYFRWIDEASDVLFTAEEAEATIKLKVQQHFSGLREAFYKFDDDHDGVITRGEFRRLLKLYMITMTDHEFERLMNKLGVSDDATLDYKEFLKRFEKQEKIESHGWLMRKHRPKTVCGVGRVNAEQADEILKIKATQQWEDITRAFRTFDNDGNGIVTKKELKNMLHRYQLYMNEEEFDKLWNSYDTDRNGYVDHKEFIAKLGLEFAAGDTDGHSKRIIEHQENKKSKMLEEGDVTVQRPLTTDVDKKLREIILERFYIFVKALVEADAMRNGTVTRSVLHKIIHANGLQLTHQQMNQVWNNFPLNDDGTMQYKNFLSFYTNGKETPSRKESSRNSNSRGVNKFHSRVRSAPLRKSTSRVISVPSPPNEGNLSCGKSIIATPPKSAFKISTPPGYVNDIEKRVKDKICERWRELENSFIEHDLLNSGVVSLESFKDVLFDYNIPLNPEDIRIMARKYEVGSAGSISYMDFLRGFLEEQVQQPVDKSLYRSKIHPTRLPNSPGKVNDHLLAVIAKLYKQVRHDWNGMRRSFRALDQQGNGTCSGLAFRHVLRKYNIELSEEEFFQLAAYYDKNVSGRITYNEFLGAFLD